MYFSFLRREVWGRSIGMGRDRPSLDYRLFVSSHGKRRALWGSFIRTPISFTGVSSSRPNCLPKSPPPKAIPLGIRVSMNGFGKKQTFKQWWWGIRLISLEELLSDGAVFWCTALHLCGSFKNDFIGTLQGLSLVHSYSWQSPEFDFCLEAIP